MKKLTSKILVSIGVVLMCTLAACSSKGNSAAANQGNQKVITDIAAIDGIKVGIIVGTTHVDYVKEDFPQAEQLAFDTPADLLHALRTRKVDAVAFEGLTWKTIAHENPEFTLYSEKWRIEPFGMIFNKKNTELLAQYNTFLSELKQSGEWQQIIDKWLNNAGEAEMPDLSQIPRSGEPLKVACTGTMAFFDFLKEGKNCGLDMEIVERFAAYLGRPIEFNMMNFGGLIAAISSNVADIGTSSMCITEERAKQVNFGDSYADSYSSILIRKENSAAAKGLMTHQDLKGKTIGTLLGSAQEAWVKARSNDYKHLVLNSKADLLNALSSGQCDAIIFDQGTQKVLEENPDIAILEEGFCPVDLAVCFPKDSPLTEQYDAFQQKLKESGELEKLAQKWLLDSDNQPAVTFEQFSGKPIRLGTTLMEQPYSYIKDNQPTGFDIELVSLFAKSIGRNVEVITYDFGGLITALNTGAIDLAANSIMITPERSNEVAFARPYLQLTSDLIVRAKDLSPEHPNSRAEKVEEKSFWQDICDSFHDNLIKEKRWQLILDGLINTVVISVFSILFGSIVGAGVCALRMSRNRLLRGAAAGFVDLIRGIPVLVLLMILYYVVFAQLGLSALVVAIITFAINQAAYTSEMYRSGLESIDPGQKRAGIAMGFTGFQTFRYIIMPQAVKRILPVFKGESISLVKTTSIVGYIAVADLTKASDLIRSRTFDAFFPLIIITIIYFILAWLLGKSLDLIGKSNNK